MTSSFLCPGLSQESGKHSTLAQLAWLVLLAGVGYGCKRNDQESRPGSEGDKHTEEFRLALIDGVGPHKV